MKKKAIIFLYDELMFNSIRKAYKLKGRELCYGITSGSLYDLKKNIKISLKPIRKRTVRKVLGKLYAVDNIDITLLILGAYYGCNSAYIGTHNATDLCYCEEIDVTPMAFNEPNDIFNNTFVTGEPIKAYTFVVNEQCKEFKKTKRTAHDKHLLKSISYFVQLVKKYGVKIHKN